MSKQTRRPSANETSPYKSPKLKLVSRSDEQKELIRTINAKTITFVRGPAGTGKTYLSVYYGLQQLFRGKFDRLIFSRPAIEADGEKLGFLPGKISEKINPFMTPVFDAVNQLVGPDEAESLVKNHTKDASITVIPIAYMRGLTFRNVYCLVDEAQNLTVKQMRMVITRIGPNAKLVLVGDTLQPDLNGHNGLEDAFRRLEGIEDIGFVTMTRMSIVRHPLIGEIEERYETKTLGYNDRTICTNSNRFVMAQG